jgi:hypothetical protein
MPFAVKARASGFSHAGLPRNTIVLPRDPLLGFGSSSEDAQAPSRCIGPPVTQVPDARFHPCVWSAAPPLRSRPLQRFPAQGSGMNWSSLPRLTACAFRFSQPLGAFIRPKPAGLVSCRIRSWGHPPELFSSRAAVRCSQRRSPLGVRTAFRVLLRARVRHSVQGFSLESSA